jgi:hypothetical protein
MKRGAFRQLGEFRPFGRPAPHQALFPESEATTEAFDFKARAGHNGPEQRSHTLKVCIQIDLVYWALVPFRPAVRADAVIG